LGRATAADVVGVAAPLGRNSVVENGPVLTMRVRVLPRWRVARCDRRAGRRLLGAVGALVAGAAVVGPLAVGAVAVGAAVVGAVGVGAVGVGAVGVGAVGVGALAGAVVGALGVRVPVTGTDLGLEARASASWKDARAAAARTDWPCPAFWSWRCWRTWLWTNGFEVCA
jgi:hypothetical protein